MIVKKSKPVRFIALRTSKDSEHFEFWMNTALKIVFM